MSYIKRVASAIYMGIRVELWLSWLIDISNYYASSVSYERYSTSNPLDQWIWTIWSIISMRYNAHNKHYLCTLIHPTSVAKLPFHDSSFRPVDKQHTCQWRHTTHKQHSSRQFGHCLYILYLCWRKQSKDKTRMVFIKNLYIWHLNMTTWQELGSI